MSGNFTQDRFQYELLKAKALEEQLPYKQVKLDDIRYLEHTSHNDHIISVQGHNYVASDRVMAGLDKLSGFTEKQKKVVFDAGGHNSLRDMRNYLSSAKAISAPNGYVMYLNPKTRRVERVLPVIDSVISLEAFFHLAEMFMTRHHLQPEALESYRSWNGSITLRMSAHVPNILALKPGEEFDLSGYYMRWQGNQIELGLYAMRLVCTNGQTISLGRSAGYHITNLDAHNVNTLLGIPDQKKLIQASFEQFGQEAGRAMVTPASIGELKSVNTILKNFQIPENECERIAPIEADMEAYRQKGFKVIDPSNTVSSVNTWELYNRLTDFATHTDFWEPNDISRDILRQNAAGFLRRPRDIKSYVNIFK